MKYNYEEIITSIESIKDPSEKIIFIEQLFSELRKEENSNYSKRTLSREDYLKKFIVDIEI